MINLVILTFANLFVAAFNLLLIARVISSWIYPDPMAYGWTRMLHSLTEPLLAPVRRLLPAMAGIDLAPLATFFVLQLLLAGLHNLL